ncbi:hypothetical protein [Lentiprolixibacter aurantiacus]|uniref:Uncharacterized protein n=1 Tax=Lentiprolixibacter aurantiacus TaxID=2993939 RepID=A0AAE3MM42_9FLAO|nr:hypothetical protein [Lentiprolixibacter aurantiacus]MCX2720370.1 hypothetical protein [Lentiprolixibacter aurantiacus]
MKQHKFFGLLMILASAFLFVQCTSELPEPIQGPPGVNGQDGVDGQDGVSGTASCVACHSNAKRDPIRAAFAMSQHADGGYPAGRVGCAQCHDSEGFIDQIEMGMALGPAGDGTVDYDGTTINCSTCHDMHKSFDFENDGQDYALRLTDGTQLFLAPSITLDFEGSSNACISCHQPRNSYPIPALNADGTYVVTSTRFAPHYGPQSTMFEGVLGAELPGPEPYPAPGDVGVSDGNGHRALSSCVECHMGPSSDPERGGHSWEYTEDACITCHGAVPGSAQDYASDMATLLTLLRNVEGVAYEEDADGNYIPTGEPVIGIIQADSEYRTNTGIFSDVAAMAAWNYTTIYHDQSRGIHNPDYTKALLKNSIEALLNED